MYQCNSEYEHGFYQGSRCTNPAKFVIDAIFNADPKRSQMRQVCGQHLAAWVAAYMPGWTVMIYDLETMVRQNREREQAS